MTDFGHFAERTARKHHECDVCGASIKPGARYSHGRHRWDGEWSESHRHDVCEAALQAVAFDVECRPEPGDVGDWRGWLNDIRSADDVRRAVALTTLAGADPDAMEFWRSVLEEQEATAP